MAHSYTSILIHYIFSTKRREKFLTPEYQKKVWAYMGGIARENKMKALAIGGIADHAHILLSLPSTIPIAKAIQLVKGGSSKWISDTFPSLKDFEWQVGYGGFSIGVSQKIATIKYIANQEEHHRNLSFEDEYLSFLKKHQIEYDERYLWD
jgi:REP element-mobilizing transposase RayT